MTHKHTPKNLELDANTAKTAGLQLTDIDIAFGQETIVNQASLALNHSEIGCLLGPSGCGKTTLLRSIAGFNQPTNGSIKIDNQRVSDNKKVIPVEKRQVGMVFQDFALFPHLTVAQNVMFGLNGRKNRLSQADKLERTNELLELIELQDKASSYPHELSGGQQQRVAMARALAPKPKIILLDEPFSSIDRGMRDALAYKVRDILKKENATTIMVTHDQTEAYAMADKIGVVSPQGQLLQWDSPLNIYHKPCNEFVANFIGISSFVIATVASHTHVHCSLGDVSLTELNVTQSFSDSEIGQQRKLLFRPENILYDNDSPVRATIRQHIFKGASFVYLLELSNGDIISANLLNTSHLSVGDSIGIRLDSRCLAGFSLFKT